MRWRFVIIAIVMLLALYPAAELTRCIIQYNIIDGPAAGWKGHIITDFYLEIGLIWGLYITIPFILNIAFKLMYHMGMRDHKSLGNLTAVKREGESR